MVTILGKYNSTPPVVKNKADGELQVDPSANLKTTTQSKLIPSNDGVQAYPDNYSYKYQAAAADNVVVKASAGYLKGIILGGVAIASASIEISDHASDGDGNIVAHPSGGDGTDALLNQTLVDKHSGYIEIGMYFATGIAVDQIAQTKVTYIYR